MAPKSFLVTGLVVLLVVAAPAAEAQLQGIIGSIFNLIKIQGIVPCSQTVSAAINGTLPPVFPNAQVQLICGAGNIIATTTTDAAGLFSIVLNPLKFLLSELLNNCRVVVPTPLSNCNPALPAEGVLQSVLELARNTLSGLFTITNIIPAGFQFLQV